MYIQYIYILYTYVYIFIIIYSPRFERGGRPHRRFILDRHTHTIYIYGFVSQNSNEAYVHVRNRYVFIFPPCGGFPS